MRLVDVQLWAHCALAYHIAEVTAPWDLAFILRAIGEALSQLLREHDRVVVSGFILQLAGLREDQRIVADPRIEQALSDVISALRASGVTFKHSLAHTEVTHLYVDEDQ